MSEIKPAATAEDWSKYLAGENKYIQPGHGDGFISILNRASEYDHLEPWVARSVAAYCLHEQPFGFTREMLEAIRECVTLAEHFFSVSERGEEDILVEAREVADRIEALLPPEKD